MIGRSLGGRLRAVRCSSLARSDEPEVRPWIARGRRKGQTDRGRPARLGHAGDRPQRLRAVPFPKKIPYPLLHHRRESRFTTRPRTSPRPSNYPKLEAISRLIRLGRPTRPLDARCRANLGWRRPDYPFAEALAVREPCSGPSSITRKELKIGGYPTVALMGQLPIKTIDEIADRGSR